MLSFFKKKAKFGETDKIDQTVNRWVFSVIVHNNYTLISQNDGFDGVFF